MIGYLNNNNEYTIAVDQDHMIQVGDHVSFRVSILVFKGEADSIDRLVDQRKLNLHMIELELINLVILKLSTEL